MDSASYHVARAHTLDLQGAQNYGHQTLHLGAKGHDFGYVGGPGTALRLRLCRVPRHVVFESAGVL